MEGNQAAISTLYGEFRDLVQKGDIYSWFVQVGKRISKLQTSYGKLRMADQDSGTLATIMSIKEAAMSCLLVMGFRRCSTGLHWRIPGF
jgi:hypothetical protein